jgi:hypothetical protein
VRVSDAVQGLPQAGFGSGGLHEWDAGGQGHRRSDAEQLGQGQRPLVPKPPDREPGQGQAGHPHPLSSSSRASPRQWTKL